MRPYLFLLFDSELFFSPTWHIMDMVCREAISLLNEKFGGISCKICDIIWSYATYERGKVCIQQELI